MKYYYWRSISIIRIFKRTYTGLFDFYVRIFTFALSINAIHEQVSVQISTFFKVTARKTQSWKKSLISCFTKRSSCAYLKFSRKCRWSKYAFQNTHTLRHRDKMHPNRKISRIEHFRGKVICCLSQLEDIACRLCWGRGFHRNRNCWCDKPTTGHDILR